MFTIEAANEAQWKNRARAEASFYKPVWHLSAPSGWINDPNGMIEYGGKLHVFYQHNPYSAEWEKMHWGHAATKDLIHFEHLPVALAPDKPYEDACYSGSAIERDGQLALIYTGRRYENPIGEVQCLAVSRDGVTFDKPLDEPIISLPPEGITKGFRDPYVFERDGRMFLVVGGSRNGDGCALLYEGDTLTSWRYRGVLWESEGKFGEMWECPCLVEVDGQDVLLFSPMRMEGHKNVAVVGSFDPDRGRFAPESWRELDIGPDFYAAQATRFQGRTMLVSWMNSWGRAHEEKKDGWCGCMTLPRELRIIDGRLATLPPREVLAIPPYGARENAFRTRVEKDAFTLRLMDGETELLTVHQANGTLRITAEGKTVAAPAGGGIDLFFDRCAAECFTLDGTSAFSIMVYPKGVVTVAVE